MLYIALFPVQSSGNITNRRPYTFSKELSIPSFDILMHFLSDKFLMMLRINPFCAEMVQGKGQRGMIIGRKFHLGRGL